MAVGQLQRKKSRLNTIAIARGLTYFLCVIGCTTNLISLSVDYFKFRTNALRGTYIPYEQTLPSVTFCVESSKSPIDRRNSSGLVSPQFVITDCDVRNFSARRVEKMSCKLSFTVSQFNHEKYQCFTIKPSTDDDFTTLDALAVLTDPRVLYKFYLSEEFETLDRFVFMMHIKRTVDEEFGFSRQVNIDEYSKNVSIQLEYHVFEEEKLPFPYETNCIDSSLCLNREGGTKKWCKRRMCVYNITLTHGRETKAESRGIFVEVRSLSAPFSRTQYVPRKIPSTFILEICSLLGLWLSLSVFLLSECIIRCISQASSHSTIAVRNSIDWHQSILNLSNRAGVDIFTFNSIIVDELSRGPRHFNVPRCLLGLLIKSLVIIIFIRESTLISADYFKFETHFATKLVENGIDKYPMVSHCIDVHEWLNVTEPEEDYEKYDESDCQ